MRSTSLSTLPSTNCRWSCVSRAKVCFNLPLAMFQFPLATSVLIFLNCFFRAAGRGQFPFAKNVPTFGTFLFRRKSRHLAFTERRVGETSSNGFANCKSPGLFGLQVAPRGQVAKQFA